MLKNPNFQGLMVLALIVGVGIVVLMQNRQPAQRILRPAPISPTASDEPAWRVSLEERINAPTFTYTPPPPTSDFMTPTRSVDSSATPQIFQVTQIRPNPLPSLTPLPTGAQTATIEFLGSTPVPSPTGVEIAYDEEVIEQFQPPPEQVPLSLQPFDHFFFTRPVDAGGNSESIFYYPYGGRWLTTARVHHGVDMPNPIGERVQAGSSGTVFWAGSVSQDTNYEGMEVYVSYGNVVVIEHDFTIEGQSVWTLYAHLSAITVEQGERVEMNDVVGLVGDTGFVTGSHVHFEIRVGTNDFWHTRNPLLWIAPYLEHGVVAGRIIDSEGIFIDEVPLQLNRGGRVVDRTTSYVQPDGGRNPRHHVVPDDNWQENFVFGDVPAGQYQVVAIVYGRRFQQTITVQPAMVNFIEFQVNPPESTAIPTATEDAN